MISNLNLCEVRTLVGWRKWLSAHHATESEVWLVFHKRASGEESIEYQDALDEALCFGWVDSLIKRIDDQRYARKFTPRKPDSRWSDINRKRYGELKEMGRMTAAGLNRPPTERRAVRPVIASGVPDYVQESLKSDRQAWDRFEKLPPSHRREYVVWIDSAKQEATKLRRLKQAIQMLTNGEKLGLK